jgi:hypothetical protein
VKNFLRVNYTFLMLNNTFLMLIYIMEARGSLCTLQYIYAYIYTPQYYEKTGGMAKIFKLRIRRNKQVIVTLAM